jgi:hypothetical protein
MFMALRLRASPAASRADREERCDPDDHFFISGSSLLLRLPSHPHRLRPRILGRPEEAAP